MLDNVNCGIKCSIFSDFIRNCEHLTVFNMINVKIPQFDMEGVLQHLCSQGMLSVLNLVNIPLADCETSLINLLETCRNSLRILRLKNLHLTGYETPVCHAISNLHQALQVSLDSTDMSSTELFPSCLTTVRWLKHLSLMRTNLTEEQTKDVVRLFPNFHLMWLNLANLPLTSVVSQLIEVLPTLSLLKLLVIAETGLNTEQMVEIFAFIPPRLQVLLAHNNDTKDDIVEVTKFLSKCQSLKYVWFDLSSVQNTVRARLKKSFEEKEIKLIGNLEEIRYYEASLAVLNNEIEIDCQKPCVIS